MSARIRADVEAPELCVECGNPVEAHSRPCVSRSVLVNGVRFRRHARHAAEYHVAVWDAPAGSVARLVSGRWVARDTERRTLTDATYATRTEAANVLARAAGYGRVTA
jgi:hypothetical protein